MRLEVFEVAGIGEVSAGDDVAALIVSALAVDAEALEDGDLVVVSSKIVSKAEGLVVAADDRDGAIATQTVRVVAERITPRGSTRIVQSRSGPVLAAAGVDNSNVAPGTVLLLPPDPDVSARAVRARLQTLTGRRLGVVISDTMGRAWRDGQVDAAIGAAGLVVSDDLRGGVDGYGNALEVTVRAVADEVASLADLVKGKLGGTPVAIVRGAGHLVTTPDGPGAAVLLRDAGQDWFRFGHVEAVRTALGVPPGTSGVGPRPVDAGPVVDRLRRAAAVAFAAPAWPGLPDLIPRMAIAEQDPPAGGGAEVVATVWLEPTQGLPTPLTSDDSTGADRAAALLTLGALGERLRVAAWSEDLDLRLTALPGSLRVICDHRPPGR